MAGVPLAIRVRSLGFAVLLAAGLCMSTGRPVCASTASSVPGELKIRTLDGKKIKLRNWSVDGDTLRGTREVWVDYERVQKPEAYALSEFTLQDGNLGGESLRTDLEAKQREAAAQQTAPQEPRVQLRLRLDDSPDTWRRGALLRSSPDSLWLLRQEAGDTLAIERSKAGQVQQLAGQTSCTGKGALIGAGVGLGAALGVLAVYGDEIESGYGAAVALGIGVFAGGGALVGAIVGGLIKKDEWVDASGLGLAIEGSSESVRLSVGFGPPASHRHDADKRP